MKRIFTLFVLLSAVLTAHARDVVVHLTDQLGHNVPNLSVHWAGGSAVTDADGCFTATGLTSAGSYGLIYPRSDAEDKTVNLDWDGVSDKVELQLEDYYIGLSITGVAENEWRILSEISLIIADGDGYGGLENCRFTDGTTQYFWWSKPEISYSGNIWLFGNVGGRINMEETDGSYAIDLSKGMKRVTVTEVLDHNGQPQTEGTLNEVPLSRLVGNYPVTFYFKYNYLDMDLAIPGYLSFQKRFLRYESGSEDVIAFRDCREVNFKLTDYDGQPLANAAVTLTDDKDRVLGNTDAGGNVSLYAYPYDYSCTIQPDDAFYPPLTAQISVGDADVDVNTGYEDYGLLTVRLKGAKARFPNDAETHWYSTNIYCITSEGGASTPSSFYAKADGDDLLLGKLMKKSYASWMFEVFFPNEAYNYLPFSKSEIVPAEEVAFTYDMTVEMQPVTFVAPEGYAFDQQIKIDDTELFLTSLRMEQENTRVTIKLPLGDHRWMAALKAKDGSASFPMSTEQEFTVGDGPKEEVFVFDPTAYTGISLTVTDIDGSPLADCYVRLEIIGKEFSKMVYTDADGRVKIYVPAANSATLRVRVSKACYLPKIIRTELTPGMVDLSVSFEDYKQFSLDIKEDAEGEPYFSYGEFIWYATDNENDERNGGVFIYSNGRFDNGRGEFLYLPAGRVEGRLIVMDYSGHQAEQNAVLVFPTDGQQMKFDVSGLQPVDFTLNGETSGFEKQIYAVTENGNVWTENTLLPLGDYEVVLAVAQNVDDYVALVTDTVRFSVKYAPLTVEGFYELTPYRKVDIEVVNVPEGAEHLRFDGFGWNGNRPVSDGFKLMVTDGTYDFAITNVYKQGSWYFVLFNPLHIPVEVAGSPVETEIDMEGYRLMTVSLGLDAFVSDPEMRFNISVYDELGGHAQGTATNSGVFRWCIRTGTYHLRVDLPDGRTYYAKFTVEADGPTEIEALFSDEPTAITTLDAGASALDATVSDNRLTVMGETDVPIQVGLVDMNGRTVFSATARPGETLSPKVPHGIYVVTLRQGVQTTTKKVVF